MRTRPFAALLAVVGMLVSPTASAQTDSATARVLFDEARQLAKNLQYEAACPKFEESYRLDPGMGTLFNLADCWEHIGRTASAWARFLEVADDAARTNESEREHIARSRADALLPKLSRVLVKVDSKDPGLDVVRDGHSLGSAQWGTAVPIDPGEHALEAKAPGKKNWSTTFVVTAQSPTVTVVVPPLEDEVTGAPSVSAPSKVVPVSEPQTQPSLVAPTIRDLNHSSRGQSTAGWVIGGVGVAGLALGAVFGLEVRSNNDKADSVCPSGNQCTSQDRTNFDNAITDARRARNLAALSFGVGGAALVTGTVLLLTASPSKSTALLFSPSVGDGRAGAVLRGTF